MATTAAEEGNCQREVYRRNYGCAIERVFSKETDDNKKKYNGKPYLEAAIDQYKAALKLDSNERSYHCLTSAYNKIFKEIVKLQEEEETLIILNHGRKDNGKYFFYKYGEDYEALIKQFLACYPNRADAHASALLYYRNLYSAELGKHPKEAAKQHYIMFPLLPCNEKGEIIEEANLVVEAILTEEGVTT